MNKLAIRPAAKVLITLEDKRYLMVAGKRGMWNLPGGGLDTDESALTAAIRETAEETGITGERLTRLREAFNLRGETTSATGVRRIAHWMVFTAGLTVPSSELQIPEGSEITAIAAMTADECLQHDNMSGLAKRAILSAVEFAI